MIYTFFRYLFSFGVGEFFEKIERRGSPCEDGPLLIVSNHPNDLLDPVLIASTYKRQLSFLAKSTIFKGTLFKSLLRSLSMIPLYRKQDAASDMGKNEESFKTVIEALKEGRAILIFPEGTSSNERRMAPIKSGAARMALQAEDANQWNLGVKIQPIGITYGDFDSFRSSVTLVFGEPLTLESYRAEYEKDGFEAARKLTGLIEDKIEEISVKVSSIEHEKLVDAIASLYRWAERGESEYELLATVAKNVEDIAPLDAPRTERIKGELSQFLEVSKVFRKFKWTEYIAAIFILPFSFLGAALNYIPYRVTGMIARRIKLFGVEIASRKFLSGIIIFILYYLILFLLAFYLTTSFLFSASLVLSSMILGQLANRTWWGLSPFILQGSFLSLKAVGASIQARGEKLIQELDKLRVT